MSPLKREWLIWMQETNNFLKLLGVERDLDGKLQGVNDNAKSLVTKLNSFDNEYPWSILRQAMAEMSVRTAAIQKY